MNIIPTPTSAHHPTATPNSGGVRDDQAPHRDQPGYQQFQGQGNQGIGGRPKLALQPKRRSYADRTAFARENDARELEERQRQQQQIGGDILDRGISAAAVAALANRPLGTAEDHHNLHHKRSTIFQNVDSMSDLISDDGDVGRRTPRPVLRNVSTEPTLPKQAAFGLLREAFSDLAAKSSASQEVAAPPSSQGGEHFGSRAPVTSEAAGGNGGSSGGGGGGGGGSGRMASVSVAVKRRRQATADYKDDALRTMDYAALRAQPFDFDPMKAAAEELGLQAAASSVTTVGGGGQKTLEDRLQRHVGLDRDRQGELFATGAMSVDDWERSGEWIVKRLGDVVSRLADARRRKRVLMTRFEDEIAEREEAVRARAEGISRTLSELRDEGEGMMRGRDVED